MSSAAPSTTASATLRHVFPYYKALVDTFGRTLPPDGDWPPLLALQVGETLNVVHAEDLTGVDEKGAAMVDLDTLVAMVVGTRPTSYGVIATAWAAPTFSSVRPAQHPNRREIVVITVGDGSEQHLLIADVIRRKKKPPRVGRWLEVPAVTRNKGTLYGGFTDVVDRVFRHAASLPTVASPAASDDATTRVA